MGRGFCVRAMSLYEYFRAGRRFPGWGGIASVSSLPLVIVFSVHVAALAVMVETENGPLAKLIFALAWGFLNFIWLIAARRRRRAVAHDHRGARPGVPVQAQRRDVHRQFPRRDDHRHRHHRIPVER